MSENLIYIGATVKALDDAGKVGGFLVLFSTASDPDISSARDFFTKETDFDFEPGEKRSVYYSHGMDSHLGRRKLGRGELSVKDAGIWVEAQLSLRDDYERKIFELAKAGKLGWSSGSAPHLVERKAVGQAHEVKSWPIVEASLTPTPAEPRTSVLTLKSFQESLGGVEPLAGKTFAEELQTVLAAVTGGVARAEQLRDIRVKEGRSLSSANRDKLSEIHGQLMTLGSTLSELLETTKPLASEEEVMGVLARYQLLQH